MYRLPEEPACDARASGRERPAERVTSGEVLGRFRLRQKLGEGGFGVVYLADDTQLGRQVALKLPRMQVLAEFDARERFVREIRAAAGLHHPNIVAVYDAGEIGGTYFLAVAYCPGTTLHQWLRENGPADAKVAAQVVLALAQAAQHAHERGVLHRDIKPRNVLLDPTVPFRALSFCPKLTDFSIAKLLDQPSDATATNVVLGTLRYMSPEHAAGQRNQVGPASDVYGLGVVLYELLTGQLPIEGADNADTLRRLLVEEPIGARQRRPTVPSDLDAICRKCLEKLPYRRYGTALALAQDLERFLAGETTVARPLSHWERAARWVRRHPAVVGWSASVATLLLVIMLGLTAHNSRLNRVNLSLDKANSDLTSALGEARSAEARATISERQTQQLLYVGDMRLSNRARLDGDISALATLLERHVPSAGQPDYRGMEWWFLRAQVELPGETLAREPGNHIYQIQLSPDQQQLASTGQDAVARIYQREPPLLASTLPTGQGEVNGVAFARGGDQLATAGDDGSVCVWGCAGIACGTRPAGGRLGATPQMEGSCHACDERDL